MLLVEDILKILLDLVHVNVLIANQLLVKFILISNDFVLVKDRILSLLAYTYRPVVTGLLPCIGALSYSHLILVFTEEGESKWST